MLAKTLRREDLGGLIDLLRRDREVVAPFRGNGRDTWFDVVTCENRGRVELHLPNPQYPPKRFVFPHIACLFRIRKNGDLRFEEVREEKPRAVFGIRSCDVAGVYHLDRFFLGGAFRDIYYERFRRNLLLVNVVCSDPQLDIDDDCFCPCADTGPAARGGFDLQLLDLGDDLLAVAGTPAGEALFADPLFRPATEDHLRRRRELLGAVRGRFKDSVSWYSAAVRNVTLGTVSEETWEEVGNRCLECGGCSYVCPTCSCFTVTDRPAGEGQVERSRIWDSCSLGGFTRMAGGHNPRKAVHDRRNRRFFHKLAHYFIQRELSVSCVGCGRCVTVCHGEVGMPSVVEIKSSRWMK